MYKKVLSILSAIARCVQRKALGREISMRKEQAKVLVNSGLYPRQEWMQTQDNIESKILFLFTLKETGWNAL